MSKPNTIPVRIGLPFHGVVTGGQLPLPNGGSKTHLQPSGQMTRLVRGGNRASLVRTTEQEVFDRIRGHTWLDHAYLSGTSLDIGGRPLGDNKFLYNDGEKTWLLQYRIEGTPSELTPRYVIIDVISEFGKLATETETQTPREIYRERLTNVGEDSSFISGVTLEYSTMQSANGSRLLIQVHGNLRVDSRDDQNDFLSLYLWESYTVTLGYAFFRVYLPDYWHVVDISGAGFDIAGTLHSRNYYGLTPRSEVFKTLSNDGTLDMLSIDSTHYLDATPYCQLVRGSTAEVVGTFGLNYDVDSPNIGACLVDYGLVDVYPIGGGDPTRIHIHEWSIAPDTTGKTYDIANDTWHPGTGCVV